MNDQSFLGTGWSFPPAFDKNSKGAVLATGATDIEQSLEILLNTAIGERFLEPAYGCDLKDYLFDSLDRSTKSLVEERIRNAILYHEPRIDVNTVELLMEETALEGRFEISVTFTIRGTNSRLNRVFPFYLQEGTEIPEGGVFARLMK